MPLRKFKPTSPGRRFMTVSTFEEVTKTELFVAPREDDGGESPTSEFFLAPREAEPADGTTTRSELFVAPREDEPRA